MIKDFKKNNSSVILAIPFLIFLIMEDFTQINSGIYNFFTVFLIFFKSMVLSLCIYNFIDYRTNNYILKVKYEWIISVSMFLIIIFLKMDGMYYRTYIYEFIALSYVLFLSLWIRKAAISYRVLPRKIKNRILGSKNLIEIYFSVVNKNKNYSNFFNIYSKYTGEKFHIKPKLYLLNIKVNNIIIDEFDFIVDGIRIKRELVEYYIRENKITFDSLTKDDYEVLEMLSI